MNRIDAKKGMKVKITGGVLQDFMGEIHSIGQRHCGVTLESESGGCYKIGDKVTIQLSEMEPVEEEQKPPICPGVVCKCHERGFCPMHGWFYPQG